MAATGLTRLLGLFNTSVGVAQLAAPAAVGRLVGFGDSQRSQALMRADGVHELAMGIGILARPHSAAVRWSRVAGGAWHLVWLSRAAQERRFDTGRVRATIGVVAAVTLLDVVAAVRRSRAERAPGGHMHASSSITVNRTPAEVYRMWRDLENLPRFMQHLQEVRSIDRNRSHWVARGPGKARVEWEAEIIEEVPEQVLSWRSSPDADVPNVGTVRFQPAPGQIGTEVSVDLDYHLPGGRAGAMVARMFGEEPIQQIKDDLRRFKQVMETGEVVRSDGVPEGTWTRRQVRQRPAKPVG